jgi:hypothetical protein
MFKEPIYAIKNNYDILYGSKLFPLLCVFNPRVTYINSILGIHNLFKMYVNNIK